MEFTKEECSVLKQLVKVELDVMKKHDKEFEVVNSPVLSSIARMKEMDLEFLKTETSYIKFLEKLHKKL